MVYMKRIHSKPAKKRIEIGAPFEDAITKYLLPKTNTGNLSFQWSVTDWVRYSLAHEIAKRNGGVIPKACKDMLPEFIPDIDL